MRQEGDRRAHPRLRERDSVVVTVLSAPEVPELEDKTFFCTTEDLSPSGLRLRLHVRVPIGAVLGLRVAFTLPLGTFRHIGRAAWVRELRPDKLYAVGVEFSYTLGARGSAWRDIVGRKLALKTSREGQDKSSGQERA